MKTAQEAAEQFERWQADGADPSKEFARYPYGKLAGFHKALRTRRPEVAAAVQAAAQLRVLRVRSGMVKDDTIPEEVLNPAPPPEAETPETVTPEAPPAG